MLMLQTSRHFHMAVFSNHSMPQIHFLSFNRYGIFVPATYRYCIYRQTARVHRYCHYLTLETTSICSYPFPANAKYHWKVKCKTYISVYFSYTAAKSKDFKQGDTIGSAALTSLNQVITLYPVPHI